eukprot:TRINITY_DN11532_c0_g1_i1.p1 TRINITY_DN11532_c0_g1~~TRINITY_DN11532_c0_g1_i1.p1  ORF type:complete len:210 (-),score=33.42 TRINITY_DN11532_c0_g1_i1:91-720(-)
MSPLFLKTKFFFFFGLWLWLCQVSLYSTLSPLSFFSPIFISGGTAIAARPLQPAARRSPSLQFDARNLMSALDPKRGKYISSCAIFRGNLSIQEIEAVLSTTREKNSAYFVDWIPDNLTGTLCRVPSLGFDVSATLLANSTSIQAVLKRQDINFSLMLKRKAFVHLYVQEGMEVEEFSSALENVRDLIREYQSCEVVTLDQEDFDHFDV